MTLGLNTIAFDGSKFKLLNKPYSNIINGDIIKYRLDIPFNLGILSGVSSFGFIKDILENSDSNYEQASLELLSNVKHLRVYTNFTKDSYINLVQGITNKQSGSLQNRSIILLNGAFVKEPHLYNLSRQYNEYRVALPNYQSLFKKATNERLTNKSNYVIVELHGLAEKQIILRAAWLYPTY
jgi:hypothetical protein